MGLYKKLFQLQDAIKAIAKDTQGNGYAYISGNKLLGLVREQMDKLHLVLLSEVVDSTFTRIDYQTKNGAKSEMFCTIKMRFTWVDSDTDESKELLWESSGMNSWDKSIGSAMTYGERYFLMKQLHLATDEDDVDRPKSAEQELGLQQIIAQINSFTTQEQLNWAFQTYNGFWGKDKEFKAAMAKKQKEINEKK